MKAENVEKIAPTPYNKVKFGCSNRQFYEVKSIVQDVKNMFEDGSWDGMVDEKCDYEGDLEKIILYNSDSTIPFITEVLNRFDVKLDLSDNLDVHLSIF